MPSPTRSAGLTSRFWDILGQVTRSASRLPPWWPLAGLSNGLRLFARRTNPPSFAQTSSVADRGSGVGDYKCSGAQVAVDEVIIDAARAVIARTRRRWWTPAPVMGSGGRPRRGTAYS